MLLRTLTRALWPAQLLVHLGSYLDTSNSGLAIGRSATASRQLSIIAACLAMWAVAHDFTCAAQRQMEFLDRGLVAVRRSEGDVFISWRLLGDEPNSTSFNVYRTEGRDFVKLNESPLSNVTHYIDNTENIPDACHYCVRAIIDEHEQASSKPAAIWSDNYLRIPIQSIDGYRLGDASVGDLNGDGQYEVILHQVSRPRDNSHAGLTGTPVLDAYRLDGTHLWRIDLGINIREGEHYTQFMVYDLDGDGRAEIVCKTADGTTDGQGKVIGDLSKDYRVKDIQDKRFGRTLAGREYLTVFDGLTGAALQTTDYIPNRDPIDGWGGIGGNGGNDQYGNRCDRFLACVAYLDGERPSVVMCRGVYGRTVLVAWDWRDGQLTQRWIFDSGISYPPFEDASPFSGMGGHSLSVADVDNDGKDEIVYQAMVVDDDGKGLYSTGLRHGDSMHVSDMYPDRPGLEVLTIQENEGRTVRFQTPGVAMRDARTGKILWSHSPGIDVKAGLAADIDPRYLGYEAWGGPGGLRNDAGENIGPKPRSTGFAVWWDGDLLRELVTGSRVMKWDWLAGKEVELFDTHARGARRGPNLVADLVGDWREELLMASPDGKSLRLYTTTWPTKHRLRTLMHDPQYRLSVAWQNVVYNKPPHPGFYLGEGMSAPPPPDLKITPPKNGKRPSIGLGEGIQCSAGTAIANGTLFVCWKQPTPSVSRHLLIHFHGADEAVKAAFARSDLNAVLAVVNFPGLSSAYAKPFEIDDHLFQQILDDARHAVHKMGSDDEVEDWSRIAVSSFSAGYGAIREILKSPKYFQRIDGIVAADSIYAGLQPNQPVRQADERQMRNFLRFASLAAEEKKSFVISHSAQPTSYASTTETADYLLRSLRLARQPDSAIETTTMKQKSRASRGRFLVMGFEGSSGKEHMQHLHNIDLFWKQLSAESGY